MFLEVSCPSEITFSNHFPLSELDIDGALNTFLLKRTLLFDSSIRNGNKRYVLENCDIKQNIIKIV